MAARRPVSRPRPGVGPMNNEPTAAQDGPPPRGRPVDKGRRGRARRLRARAAGRPASTTSRRFVTGVGLDTLINREETFGPIVPLIRVGLGRGGARSGRTTHTSACRQRSTRRASRARSAFSTTSASANVVVNDSTDYWGGARAVRRRLGGRRPAGGRIGRPLHDARHDRPQDGRARRRRKSTEKCGAPGGKRSACSDEASGGLCRRRAPVGCAESGSRDEKRSARGLAAASSPDDSVAPPVDVTAVAVG